MAFDGKEGAPISLISAAQMTRTYRNANPNSTIAHFLGKDVIKQLLEQADCVGIRVYHGINDSGKKELVLVGVDGQENDLLDLIVDRTLPCGGNCSVPNLLNS